jgi:hypothetical protein
MTAGKVLEELNGYYYLESDCSMVTFQALSKNFRI